MNFIKNVLATVIGIFVFLIVSFFMLIAIGAAFGNNDEIDVKDNSVITLDLSKVSLDYAGQYEEDSPFNKLLLGKKNTGFITVLNAIKYAKEDSKIKGISLINNQSALGMAQTQELRNALEDFKKSGKFVYSYANYYTQKEFYISSVSDAIYLNPIGEIDFKGLSSELLFFKNFQDQTGLKMEVIRHGKYKSAVEPFIAQEMSPENRQQITELLQSVWKSMVQDVARNRSISVPQLDAVANDLLARTPQMALQQKLIDKIAYEDQYHDAIKTKLKLEKEDEYEQIDMEDYSSANEASFVDYSKDDIIAVIYAQGEIQGGEGDVNIIGEGSINRSLKEAREDKSVKAVVLRVNSPGGSALTSELIWREIELTKKVKPVVVSMGNLAASGGYYIACGANAIFAEPTTITGSIGVFGTLPNMHEIATKYGINAEQVTTHKNSNGYSVFEPLNDNYRALALEGVDQIYTTFITRVANGRKMTTSQVDAIGQGRVWSGSEAIKIGLVDKIGNLDAAIAHAASLAKTKSYTTEDYPIYKKDFEELFGAFASTKLGLSKEEMIKNEIGAENYSLLQQAKKWQSRKGVQAIIPFEINFK
jgi:protease IV